MIERSSRRGYALTVFCALLACYGYFVPKLGRSDWAASSRADLVYAVGDVGSLAIDAYHTNTDDKAFFEGHYYTVGSIGPSLVALPVYLLFKGAAALPPLNALLDTPAPGANTAQAGPPQRYAMAAMIVLTFFAVSVPSALLGVVVFLFAARLCADERAAFWVALVYGLATIAFPYSKALYQHQLAALGAFGGFFLLWNVAYADASQRWLWAAGALFGLVAITEYPVALFAGLIVLWACSALPRPLALSRVVLGAAPLLAVFAAYNLLIFHTPLPIGYRYHVLYHDLHAQGFMGITRPALDRLYGITLSPYRGLFFISPVLLLALPGLALMWRQRRDQRRVVLLLATLIAGFFAYNASYIYWSGGNTIGPRFLAPMVPFMMLPLAFAAAWARRAVWSRIGFWTLAAASLVNVWAQTIAGQFYPPETFQGRAVTNPLLQYALPQLRAGDVALNYGSLAGLRGLWSLLPLLIGLAALGAALLWHRRRQLWAGAAAHPLP